MPGDKKGKRQTVRISERRKANRAEARRKEVKQFLHVLGLRIEELMENCTVLKEKGRDAKVHDYLPFHNLMSECLTFLVVIERRIKNLSTRHRDELRPWFEELVVALWSVLMEGSLNFLRIISEVEHLPLGSRVIFVKELRTLHEAQEKLNRKRYRKYLTKDLKKQLGTAVRILNKVIERAPSLLNLK